MPQSVSETIPSGYISIHAYSVSARSSQYPRSCRLSSEELSATLFVSIPDGLERYFDSIDQSHAVPCIVEDYMSRGQQCYTARLLAPPCIKEGSGLFVRGMAVPSIRIRARFGPRDSPTGYKLRSAHLGSQALFSFPYDYLQRASGAEFQGVIEQLYGGDKNPRVRITLDSVSSPDVFVQNAEKLEELARELASAPERFWWNLDLE